MINITYYKYKIFNKITKETKYFIKFNDVRSYCGISRPQIYKIFNGAKPKKWITAYDFESIRIPTYLKNTFNH